MTDDKKLEIYYDHYKDTFQHQVRYIENRNRYFLLTILLTVVLSLFIVDRNTSNTIICKITGLQELPFAHLNSVLLFCFLWILILYFQSMQTVERQYKYVHFLEDELNKNLTPFVISREGKLFKSDRTIATRLVTLIYKYFHPLSMILVVLGQLIGKPNPDKNFWVDLLLSLIIVLFIVLQFVRTFSRKKKTVPSE